MPGKVKVKIVSGRNLPVMDRGNLTTDAYVEVKLGSSVHKTDVYRKSLNPVWNSEWFRFEMDDLELQDEPLQIRLMDHDTYSSNDAIGKVYLDLNPLLCNSSRGKDTSGKMISGWIPVYDTMHGIRGEVNLIVKVELFSDWNKFRQSSCGVRFFFTQSVPEGYIAHTMQGFVEELVVNDDPEYQWIDKIRTPRASNEARQTLFSKLSGEVQRRVGLKALELGGNAVIGYKQCFDLEGESGIVVRGIGTAAYLTKQYESQLSPTCGESLGLSREVAELQQGYRSFSKKGRSLRKRGGPGRPPRLQRRSFRLPNSADSMSATLLHQHHSDGGTGRKQSHDDTCLMAHPHTHDFDGGSLLEPGCGGGAIVKHGSFEGFQERSSSFHKDSVLNAMRANLRKGLTSSTQSIPPTSSSPADIKDAFCTSSRHVSGVTPSHLSITSSEPCIEVSSMQSGDGEITQCQCSTTMTSPMPKMPKPLSQSLAPNNNSASHSSRCTSRLSHSLSPRYTPRHQECASTLAEDHTDNRPTSNSPQLLRREGHVVSTSFDDTSRSRNALASCITHNPVLFETIRPTVPESVVTTTSDQETCLQATSSKSVFELEVSNIPDVSQAAGFLGSYGDFESTGSHLGYNAEGEIDEDSTSDNSSRQLYCPGRLPPRVWRRCEGEIESDTSKDFTKASSGNEGCSVDNDELSPVSERDGFLLLRKKRGSRRKDRYSKSSLAKRASTNFSEKGYLLGGTERIKEEVVKFFKRKKSSDDNESCGSSTKNATTNKKYSKAKSSPYREAKFFFRRRRTTSNNPSTSAQNPLSMSGRSKSSSQLFRSNSDSHSLGQTSLDSMPSVGSEPAYEPDQPEEDDSGILPAVVGPPPQKILEVEEESKAGEDLISSVVQTPKILTLTKGEVREMIKELGYSTESPLKLYISSMDALLAYDPSDDSPATTGTLVADCGVDGASACSNSSALSTAMFPIDQKRGVERQTSCSQSSAGSSSTCQNCSTSSTCKPSVAMTHSAKTHMLFRQDTVKAALPPSHLSDSDTSRLNSVSTLSSSRSGIGTNDSFSTNTSDSTGSFSVLTQVHSRGAGCSQSHIAPADILGDNRCSYCCSRTNNVPGARGGGSPLKLVKMKSCPIHTQIGNAVSLSGCNQSVDKGEEGGGLVFSSRREHIGDDDDEEDDDILIVASSQGSGSENRGGAGDKDDEALKFNLSVTEHIVGVTGCRSPIPEELLCDRSTPTQANMTQNNTTLAGGVSNFSISTITNNIAHQGPTSSSAVHHPPRSCNILHGGVAPHSDAMTLMNYSNATTITSTTTSTNNSTCSTNMTSGGANYSLTKLHSSEDKCGVVARHDNGTRAAVATLDESAVKNSVLASSTPYPPHSSCDPRHSKNGVSHRPGAQHTTNSSSSANETPSIESESAGYDARKVERSNSHDRNGSLAGSSSGGGGSKVAPNPKVAAHHSSHHPIKHQISSPAAAPMPGPPNITTMITTTTTTTGPATHSAGGALHRRSSESDLSTPPKPSAMPAHVRNFSTTGMKPGITAVDQYGLMEYPFITVSQFPPGFLTRIGGTVTARSVKLLERISNLDEPESRDAWWNEIRMEIRSHCRAFGCTVVVGYEELTTMCDDVCVLSASGTAAIATTTIGLKNVELLTVSTKQGAQNPVIPDPPCPGRGVEKDRGVLSKLDSVINSVANNGVLKHVLVSPSSKLRHDSDDPNCSMLHIPSNPSGLPFSSKLSRCQICRKGRVPDVLIVTVDVPPGLHITGKGTLIQAQVFRPKKDCKGEISAKEVSDSLPFLEYELHRRLINKLKVKGMNAIFGLTVQICLGDRLMVAVATGTAMYVTALPPPGVPIITAGNLKTDAQKVLQYQKVVQDVYDRNRQHYDLKTIHIPTNGRQSGSSDGEESDEDENTEIRCSSKDTYILEVDDAEDIDIISMLIDPHPTIGFLMNNIDYLHGYEEHHVSSQQLFTQVWRCRIPTLSLRQFTAYFERLIRSVSFKLRKMMPCVLSKLSFRVELPEPDEMQISIIGLALGMVDLSKTAVVDKTVGAKLGSILSVAKETDMMFPLDEDGNAVNQQAGVTTGGQLSMVRSGDVPFASNDNVAKDLHRSTPPPSGIIVPVGGPMNNASLVVAPRHYSHQTTSSSPQSHSSSHVSGNGCGHANGSGTALPPPQLSKRISGDSGNPASSSNSILRGHGLNYSFRGGTHSQPFSLSRSGSKVIPKSGPSYGWRSKFVVEITPLAYIPGARIDKYLGNLNFFFIRETTSIRENGGLSGFVHNFVAEVLAIVRAHVAALGGNAMVSYFMTELALLHNPHKNQGQCLVNVGGDVVLIFHPSTVAEDSQMSS